MSGIPRLPREKARAEDMIRSVEWDPATFQSLVKKCIADTDRKLMEENDAAFRIFSENTDQLAFLAGAYYDTVRLKTEICMCRYTLLVRPHIYMNLHPPAYASLTYWLLEHIPHYSVLLLCEQSC